MVIEGILVESLIYATWSLRSCHQHKFETVCLCICWQLLAVCLLVLSGYGELEVASLGSLYRMLSPSLVIQFGLELCLSAKSSKRLAMNIACVVDFFGLKPH